MEIRNIRDGDVPALLALNNAEAERVNALTEEALSSLLARAFAARITADGQAFLIAFDHATPPQGPNHAWFTARESYFAYIDRVVVAPGARGRGLARALYDDLARIALGEATNLLVCEVNLDPPNPESMAFHERLGFTACGEAVDHRNGKRVQYLRKPLQG
ncbi:GNAT family N-acetyltransferase [Sediminicoccus sp. KRV36]|uniref:GNAT family N-acetyltransferase n=1 Tax=Sediminicoccus sp. KRV36 TaxID=3133721 RepID=UPI00200EF50E|nr:GNAT family N-acetyltransferase [Sediminicoccus rosea]UPY37282.1 GNAT family N-acetyltransferase [Sediminicoccus rosea]